MVRKLNDLNDPFNYLNDPSTNHLNDPSTNHVCKIGISGSILIKFFLVGPRVNLIGGRGSGGTWEDPLGDFLCPAMYSNEFVKLVFLVQS